MKLNPENDYIHFSTDGRAEVVPGGSAFWSLPPDEMAAFDRGWLVTEHVFTEDWHHWEMHPEGDELVYLLDGEVDIPRAPRSHTLSIAVRCWCHVGFGIPPES